MLGRRLPASTTLAARRADVRRQRQTPSGTEISHPLPVSRLFWPDLEFGELAERGRGGCSSDSLGLDGGPASTVTRCRPRRRSQLSALVMPTGYSGDTGLFGQPRRRDLAHETANGETSQARRTVMVACRSSPSSEPDRWPSGAVTLVTTHVLSPRTNMSPSPKTRAVSQSSVLPFGKKMVIWRGTTPRFRPPWRYGSGVGTRRKERLFVVATSLLRAARPKQLRSDEVVSDSLAATARELVDLGEAAPDSATARSLPSSVE